MPTCNVCGSVHSYETLSYTGGDCPNDPEREEEPWDECECGHERDQHSADVGIGGGCMATASSGGLCACPGFKGVG